LPNVDNDLRYGASVLSNLQRDRWGPRKSCRRKCKMFSVEEGDRGSVRPYVRYMARFALGGSSDGNLRTRTRNEARSSSEEDSEKVHWKVLWRGENCCSEFRYRRLLRWRIDPRLKSDDCATSVPKRGSRWGRTVDDFQEACIRHGRSYTSSAFALWISHLFTV
jgi:hypothetical protein